MELRHDTSHLHFIHAIKKGTVVELVNQSASGVPVRKFRSVEDIYGDKDSFRDFSLARRKPRKKSSASVTGRCVTGIRIMVCSVADSLRNEPLSSEAAGYNGADDFSLDELTLRQLKENHKKKEKKRKAPESDLRGETSLAGKEYSDSQPDDEESDLLLPLSCFVSNFKNNRKVNFAKKLNLGSQSEKTVIANHQKVTVGIDSMGQVESTNEQCKLADQVLEARCSNNGDYDGDSSYSSTDFTKVDPSSRDLPGKTAKSIEDSKMMYEEHASLLVQESFSDYSEYSRTCPPSALMTILKETESQEYALGALGTCQSLQQECLPRLPVSKVSLQEDAKLFPDVYSDALSPSMDLASREHDNDNFDPHCTANEVTSQAGNDHINLPEMLKTSVETEILANPEVVCQSQLCQSPMHLLETDVLQEINLTPLADACLDVLSKSVDHVSDAHGNSEPRYLANDMASRGLSSLVVSNHHPDRLTINNEISEKSNPGGCCQSFQNVCVSYLPSSDVNKQEDIDTSTLLDVTSDAPSSAEGLTFDNDDPGVNCNVNQLTPPSQIDTVSQQTDDHPVADPAYEVNTTGECLHMVKKKVEVAETSNLRDSLITSSLDNVSQLASSSVSCYFDSALPAYTTQPDQLHTGTFCGVTEASNNNTTGCDWVDKPFVLTESHQRSRSHAPPERLFSGRKAFSPALQKKLCEAMENFDSINSREKLRSLGKLFSENLNKKKNPSVVKGNQTKRLEQVNKCDTSVIRKHSENKSNGHVNERNRSGILKTSRLPSSHALARKDGQCIRSCPESAIVFSKRQMQDIEALAKKLTNELTCMKGIIEERFNHEISLTGTHNDNNDQY
uniref:Uncharacterized protein n=1 Tax=Kalanchoe fedtschenkoi TaxID=63787 RepID=A0A7N0VBE9_KALFE